MDDYTRLSENLFAAVDTIYQERIKGLQYNKTIKCSITDISNASKGEYTVTDGSSTFTAFSEITTYQVGNYVYVLVPNGDYTQQKSIIGRYVTADSEYYTYVKPTESFVNITGNIIDLETIDSNIGLTANGTEKEYLVWESAPGLCLYNYDRLALQGNFKTWLSSYHLDKGDYGLRLDVVVRDLKTTQVSDEFLYYSYYLSSENMYGDVYNFESFYPQEIVFDISNIDHSKYIFKMSLSFYQNGDFSRKEQAIAASKNKNLFFEKPYIAFGYALENFNSDKALLGTLDSSYYATYFTDAKKEQLGIESGMSPEQIASLLNKYNKKRIYARWIHQTDLVSQNEGTTTLGTSKFVAIQKAADMPENTMLHWYRYKLGEGICDSLAGPFWEEMPQYRNCFDIDNFYPDATMAEERIKIVVEKPTSEYLALQLEEQENIDIQRRYAKIYEEYGSDEEVLYNAIRGLGISLTVPEFKSIAEQYLKTVAQVYGQQVLYESEVLIFTNESPVADKATFDLIQGLTIEVDKNGTGGIYRMYDEMGELNNTSEGVKKRLLTAHYKSLITGQADLDTAESITWIFPTSMTMIQLPEDGVEYDSANDIVEDKGDGYIYITRHGVVSSSEPGSEEADTAQQYFRIKSHYSQLETNNVIRCRLIKNNVTYEAFAELTFGPTGMNGTDYTVVLEFESKEPAITINAHAREFSQQVYDKQMELNKALQEIEKNEALTEEQKEKQIEQISDTYYRQIEELLAQLETEESKSEVIVVPHVYDYSGAEITDLMKDMQFKYSWYSQNNNSGISFIQEGKKAKLTASGNIENCQFYILQLNIDNAATIQGADSTSRNVDLVAYLPIPVRYSDVYSRLDGNSNIAYNTAGVNPTYYKDSFKLYLYNAYKTIEAPAVQWRMGYGPDIINPESKESKKFYPTIHEESGKMTVPSLYMIDNSKQICINAYRNDKLVWTQPLRIYQYVYDSVMLNSWDGNLTFDEKNGTILSAMIGAGKKDSQNRFHGVLMGDVRKAGSSNNEIGLFGYHEGDQSFGFNIDGKAFIGKSNRGQILLDGNKGTIQSASYKQSGNGMMIDLDDGILIAQQGGAKVKIDPNNNDDEYFSIKSKNGNNLLKIGINDYFLQTDNFNREGQTGLKIDLQRGSLSGYDFELEAQGGTGSDARIRFSSKSPYLQIKSSSGTTLMHVSDGSYYLRSNDFADGSAGFELNLGTGSIRAYKDFKIQAENGGNRLTIDSSGGTAIYVGGSGGASISLNYDGSLVAAGGHFRVDTEGKLFAAGGTVGGWVIGPNTLSNGTFTLNAANGSIESNNTKLLGGDGTINSKNGTFEEGHFTKCYVDDYLEYDGYKLYTNYTYNTIDNYSFTQADVICGIDCSWWNRPFLGVNIVTDMTFEYTYRKALVGYSHKRTVQKFQTVRATEVENEDSPEENVTSSVGSALKPSIHVGSEIKLPF